MTQLHSVRTFLGSSILVLVLTQFDLAGSTNVRENVPIIFKVSHHRQKRAAMYPGTKWCGDGDTAANYDDLGYNSKTDSCCRAHDNCPDYMKSNESKRGLINNTPYSRLHCNCDEAFRHCLKNVSNIVSNIVGSLYFDVAKATCYKEEYPATCWDRDSSSELCLNYTYDTAKEKKWQYFDQPPWRTPKRRHQNDVTTTTSRPTANPMAATYSTSASGYTNSSSLYPGTSLIYIAVVAGVTLLFILQRTYCISSGVETDKIKLIPSED